MPEITPATLRMDSSDEMTAPAEQPGEAAPAGWWWSARRCPNCDRLVLERITPRAEALVAVHQVYCRTCSWSETTPV